MTTAKCHACGKVGQNEMNPQGTRVVAMPLGWATVQITATPVRNYLLCAEDLRAVEWVCSGGRTEEKPVEIIDIPMVTTAVSEGD